MISVTIGSQLIEESLHIMNAYQARRNENGLDFNIFTLLDVERNELETHEYMLYAILNFRADKQMKDLFIQKFLEVLGLPNGYVKEKWEIEKEYYITNGRIDLFFKSKGMKKKCIVLELKIDAEDQEKQIERYEDYIIKRKYDDYRIIYLTLDGKEPSQQSIGNIHNKRKLICKSFREHILLWLEECIEICRMQNIETSFIQQYKILIKKIVNEDNMQDEIANLIKNSGDLKASLEIANVLPAIKAQILYNLLDSIHNEFEKKNSELIYQDYECAKDYYGTKAQIPNMAYKIAEYSIGSDKKVILGLGIEVDYKLFYYFGYYIKNDDGYELYNSNEFKSKHKRISKKVEDALTEVLNVEVRENSYDSIWFKHIVDKNNHKYDFKHFSDNCAELMDSNNLTLEAKRISRELNGYIEQLKRYLVEN